MSLIDDALKRAGAEFKQQQPVIQVPGEPRRSRFAQNAMYISFLVLALVLVLQSRSETQTRAQIDQLLAAKVGALETKHDELMSLIQKNDSFLDTRVQLDIMELKSDTKALRTQLESVGAKDIESVKSDTAALRDYLKTEVFFMNKRLHENEREHYLLSERINGLKDRASSASESSSS